MSKVMLEYVLMYMMGSLVTMRFMSLLSGVSVSPEEFADTFENVRLIISVLTLVAMIFWLSFD